MKAELKKANLLKAHPELDEVWDKFDEFRNDPENKGMSLETAAKAFRVETGLATPKRKGLEKSTGGDRVPVKSSLSPEEAAKLRSTDFKKYREMLKKGQIRVE